MVDERKSILSVKNNAELKDVNKKKHSNNVTKSCQLIPKLKIHKIHESNLRTIKSEF